ncbi:MAG: hypothetical protein SGCHY_000958 [Lobulomycetales sp.]
MKDIFEIANEFLALDRCPRTTAQIEDWIVNNDREALERALRSRMVCARSVALSKVQVFGTAGLRAEMGAGYARMNDLTIIQTTQGLCEYLLSSTPAWLTTASGPSVVIGHDHRHNSETFARLAASVFLAKKVKVYYFRKLVHTPLVPFTVTKKGCIAGIMITASHNPAKDNGYKVYWSNGCQIVPPHDANIASSIMDNLAPMLWDYKAVDRKSSLVEDPFEEISEAYFKALLDLAPSKSAQSISPRSNAPRQLFCYTPMHGVGLAFAQRAFQVLGLTEFVPVTDQMLPDPDFKTVSFPNPEEKGALDLAMGTAAASGCPVIFANDPDADRLAVSEILPDGSSWYTFTGNEIGFILGCLVWQDFQASNASMTAEEKGKVYMLSSTVSWKMLARVAQAEGFSFEETLTGFKWLGNRSKELIDRGCTVLLAFEEAIGFMVGKSGLIPPAVLDKDGITAAAVLAMHVRRLYDSGDTLKGFLDRMHQRYGYAVTENSYYICNDPVKTAQIFHEIRFGVGYAGATDDVASVCYPKEIGGIAVTGIRDLTLGYDTSKEGFKPALPVSPSSQMITFTFANGAVITLRTSGTEPKLKYYSELAGPDKDVVQRQLHALVEEFCRVTLKPVENGLSGP